MPWWVWLSIGWVLIAVLLGVLLGRSLSLGERGDWLRRGRPDRRKKPR
ncbi:hypothetical protein ABC795_01135 [Blastococcus sp. HT6-30]